jgi:hypothetical protein
MGREERSSFLQRDSAFPTSTFCKEFWTWLRDILPALYLGLVTLSGRRTTQVKCNRNPSDRWDIDGPRPTAYYRNETSAIALCMPDKTHDCSNLKYLGLVKISRLYELENKKQDMKAPSSPNVFGSSKQMAHP